MQGYRTIVVALVSGPLSAWCVNRLGITLTAEQQAYVVGGIMSGVMTIMRFVTSTPVPWLVKRLNDEQVAQVTAIVKEQLSKYQLIQTQPGETTHEDVLDP